MVNNFRIALYGPSNSGKSFLLKRFYELYREASLHNIRYLGGSKKTGIDYCAFKLGNIKYEFYAPPGTSYVKVFRNKIVKNADGILFMIPPYRRYLDRVSSFLLDLKKILFEKYGIISKKLPVIYVLNYTNSVDSGDRLEPADLIEALNMPNDAIIYGIDLNSEKSVRELFGRIVHLVLFWRTDKKKYFVEYDRWLAEVKSKYSKKEKIEEIEKEKGEAVSQISIPIAPEIPSPPQSGESPRSISAISSTKITILEGASISLKRRLLENYINEVAIIDFDRTVGHVPIGYIFGHGKLISYANDPVFLTELGIIAKHSLGFILRDGITFVGILQLSDQGMVVLETTVSHMKKILGIVRRLRKFFQKLVASDVKSILATLEKTL